MNRQTYHENSITRGITTDNCIPRSHGCKWTLRQLRRYFQQAGISDWLLWQKITSLITLTVLSHVSQIPPTTNCFEFFGFDVLIDKALRPWLLEVNLSPALSNDCDADRLVKKPMLHDMFDLLGLPLYNTGLSIFNIFSDAIDENSKEDIENKVTSLMSTISVVNAAGRWRRKQKKMSAIHSRSGSSVRTRSRFTSANIQKNYIMLPKVQVDLRNIGSPSRSGPLPKQVGEDLKRGDLKSWGNGRDWNFAKPREGGWVRIWPLVSEASIKCNDNNSSGHIKAMVQKVSKFTKKAKELAKRHPTASESQLSEYLQEEMKINGDIWIPPI